MPLQAANAPHDDECDGVCVVAVLWQLFAFVEENKPCGMLFWGLLNYFLKVQFKK